MFEKSEIDIDSYSAQSSLQKLNLAIAVKKHPNVDIRLFMPCQILLNSSILSEIF